MVWRDTDVEKIVHSGALLERRVKAPKGKAGRDEGWLDADFFMPVFG